MSTLLDERPKEKYRTNAIKDPLAFMKDAIDWNTFIPLMNDLYRCHRDLTGST